MRAERISAPSVGLEAVERIPAPNLEAVDEIEVEHQAGPAQQSAPQRYQAASALRQFLARDLPPSLQAMRKLLMDHLRFVDEIACGRARIVIG